MRYRYELNHDHEAFRQILIDIKKYFDNSDRSIHKARNELRIADILGEKCVIKAFKVPHLVNRFAYTFLREGKAKKSYRNAMRLRALGVATPEPIGYIEFFRNGLLHESYYLSLHEAHDFTIRDAFHHKTPDHRAILQAFAAFTYDLHQKGVWHVDYSPGNILVTKEEHAYRFALVDINRMQFRPVSGYEGLANFSKFWAKEEDLRLMARTYAELAGFDAERSVRAALAYDQKLRRKTDLKRRLKGKK